MVVALPNSSNDAALNAQLDITRDASIANLRQKSDEVQTQYRDEAAKIQDQKQRSAEVVQSSVNAALDNAALRSEAEYNQAFKNFQTVQDLAMRASAANPRETKLPLELHRQIVESTHKFLSAQSDYVSTHPDKASDPAYNIRLAEDGNGGFQLVNGLDPGLAAQVAITSPDEARTMPLEELRRNVQRPNQRQVNPNEPLVTFIDQPDGTFTAKLVTGETFTGFKADENRDAIRKLAESKVNTRRHYENLAQQQQPANGQQTEPQAQPQVQPGNDPAVNSNQSLTDWFLDETAKRFGYQNGAEMVADQNARYAARTEEQRSVGAVQESKHRFSVLHGAPGVPEYRSGQQCARDNHQPERMGMDTGQHGSGACTRGATSRLSAAQPTGNRSRKRPCSRGAPASSPAND